MPRGKGERLWRLEVSLPRGWLGVGRYAESGGEGDGATEAVESAAYAGYGLVGHDAAGGRATLSDGVAGNVDLGGVRWVIGAADGSRLGGDRTG